MSNLFASLADLWVSRYARPAEDARQAVSGLSPAVVVTGGSRGIGRALAFRFAAAGQDIAIVARDADVLAGTAARIASAHGVRVVPITLDVVAKDAPERINLALRKAGLFADILVNNAGVGLSGAFTAQTAHDLDDLVSLNVAAVTRLMRHALPPMLARGRGGILNVASLGGLVPGPNQAAYYASKAYVVSLTEAVAYEVRGQGVRIAALAPGPVNTRFHHAMDADTAVYRRIVPAQSAETVAASAYRNFKLGRKVIVPGVLPSACAVAVRVLPHALSLPIVSALLSAPRQPPET